MAFRETPPHHVSHSERFNSQQVEDHSVGQPELGLQDGRFALSKTDDRVRTERSSQTIS